ncbi:hypothetical protein ACLOJK_012664 [Asimina triloba]
MLLILMLKAMLYFIYSDDLPDIHEFMGSISMCTSTNMIQHLLAAADRYDLDRLKLLCEAKLCEEVNADTVATTLALAEQHHCSQLKSVCLKFAASPGNLGGFLGEKTGHKIGNMVMRIGLQDELQKIAGICIDGLNINCSAVGVVEDVEKCMVTYKQIPSCFVITKKVVMQSDGFGYLEETCPSLLSELLETVAVVDDDTGSVSRKRSGSSNIGLNLPDDLDLNGKRFRRRL